KSATGRTASRQRRRSHRALSPRQNRCQASRKRKQTPRRRQRNHPAQLRKGRKNLAKKKQSQSQNRAKRLNQLLLQQNIRNRQARRQRHEPERKNQPRRRKHLQLPKKLKRARGKHPWEQAKRQSLKRVPGQLQKSFGFHLKTRPRRLRMRLLHQRQRHHRKQKFRALFPRTIEGKSSSKNPALRKTRVSSLLRRRHHEDLVFGRGPGRGQAKVIGILRVRSSNKSAVPPCSGVVGNLLSSIIAERGRATRERSIITIDTSGGCRMGWLIIS